MSQYLPGTAAAMAGTVAVVVLEAVGVADGLVFPIGIGVAIVAFVLYVWSPLPNHNGPL